MFPGMNTRMHNAALRPRAYATNLFALGSEAPRNSVEGDRIVLRESARQKDLLLFQLIEELIESYARDLQLITDDS